MFKNLYYRFLLLFNWWQECNEPLWVKQEHIHYNIYNRVYFYIGKTFEYKLLSENWGQGWSDTVCYRRFTKRKLREKAGMV